MEIRDIQISLILDQYLEWMQKRKELDLEIASEFVTMASQLIYIKTRMLLSIHDEEALSEMEQLIASGVMSAEEQKRLLAQYDMGGVDQDFAPEEAVNIEVEQNIAPFLSDHKLVKLDLEPTKIVKNPEGTMARNALAGQAMMQERKLLRERQMREEREKLPEVRACAWRDV